MLDRITNVLVVFIVVGALAVLAVSLKSAWDTTAVWDKEWTTKPAVHPAYSAQRLLVAIRNATEANDNEAVSALEQVLEANYEPSGKILVRFSRSDLSEAAILTLATLLFLVIPVSLNYIRNGKAKFWNKSRA